MAGQFIDGPAPPPTPKKAKAEARVAGTAKAVLSPPKGQFIDGPGPAPTNTPLPAGGFAPVIGATPPPTPAPAADQRQTGLVGQALQSPAGQAVGAALKQKVTTVSNILDYQHAGALEHVFHGGSEDENRKRLREKLGVEKDYEDPKLFGVIPQPEALAHAERGLFDISLDTLTDPLTPETLGVGPLVKYGIKFAPDVLKGLSAMKAVNATPLGQSVYDLFHWGGPVARAQGPEAVDRIRGAMNMAGSTGRVVQQHLVSRFNAVTKGLSDAEKVRVGKALGGEMILPGEEGVLGGAGKHVQEDGWIYATVTDKAGITRQMRYMPDRPNEIQMLDPDKAGVVHPGHGAEPAANPAVLTPKEQSAYKQLRTLTELDYKMRRDATRAVILRQLSAQLKLSQADQDTLAHAFRTSVAPTVPRGLPKDQRAAAQALKDTYASVNKSLEQMIPKRDNYMPWAHEGAAKADEPARTINTSERYDPRAQHRPDIPVTEPGQLESGFKAMAANTGRQVGTGIVHKALGDLMDDPQVNKLFEQVQKATGDARTPIDKVKEGWLKLVGYPRAATVSLTPRHAANILDLAANTVPLADQPQFFKETMALAARLANPKITAKQYRTLTQEGRNLGAMSGDFTEREPFFQGVPGLRTWTAANNRLVWAVDEAAKQTYAKLIAASGEAKGLEAGGKAAKRLVDYSHVSPFVKALRYVAPFGTFRGSVPGAVAGGIARNPMRAAFYNRATQGTMYGNEPAPGQHGVTLYNPTADVSRGIDAPQEFVRGTLGAPAVALGTIAAEAFAGQPGASLREAVNEVKRAPGQIAQRQFDRLGTPAPKQGTYANSVKLRTARFLNYGNPIDLRWLLSAAAAGVVEAQAALEQIGATQFQPKPGTLPQRAGEEVLRQAGGVGVK